MVDAEAQLAKLRTSSQGGGGASAEPTSSSGGVGAAASSRDPGSSPAGDYALVLADGTVRATYVGEADYEVMKQKLERNFKAQVQHALTYSGIIYVPSI